MVLVGNYQESKSGLTLTLFIGTIAPLSSRKIGGMGPGRLPRPLPLRQWATARIDYDPAATISQDFFATVQNKLQWATHGHTAAEVIRSRADAAQLNMGQSIWKNAPRGPFRKCDVEIAKNYLSEPEIPEPNRVVTMYLDYAEFLNQKLLSSFLSPVYGT
jgi:hypothetical protein